MSLWPLDLRPVQVLTHPRVRHAAMKCRVIASGANEQVRIAIVGRVPIEMMYLLSTFETPS